MQSDATAQIAQGVLEALGSLANAGPDGLKAAKKQSPAVAANLIKQVHQLLAAPDTTAEQTDELSPDDRLEGTPSEEELRQVITADTAVSKGKSPSRTKQLADKFGSKGVTNMIRFVILQHLANHPRERTVGTILDELLAAKLLDKKQRTSLVTNLNRLKKTDQYITWPERKRGEQITLTPQGQDHLRDLITEKLQAEQIDYLRENAPASIIARLPASTA